MGQRLNEEEVKLRLITPAIENAGWDRNSQIRMEYAFTDGEMQIRGSESIRGKLKRADYVLFYKSNIPLAVVEAKDNLHSIGDGLQQGLSYAETLDIPYVYSSNGSGFLERDRLNHTEVEISLNEFPSPQELWERYINKKSINKDQEKIITQPYYFDAVSKKTPRYYQRIAINRTVEAIAKGQNRILLVMATGTGKTFTAFQIAHRLKEAGIKKRILYLADRNILIDQTMVGDFKPFDKVMTKIEQKKLDSSYEIYFALYHQLIDEKLEKQPFTELDSEFFDLIIIDECHRGSAKDDSQWRQILEYFSSATQIGMTATPKEDKKTSNIHYFGDPLYIYSLKDGIKDGFLAPYRVIRIAFDKDLEGYTPEKGKTDTEGNALEYKEYTTLDYDTKIIIDNRTKQVAKKITEFLKNTDRYAKTIVFCVDTEHANRMRQALINENSDMLEENENYIMRITGDDKEGKNQLDYFMDVDEKFPTIVTTSRLLTTGVDCKTCKLIVLDTNINSMTEFKQIIGRGTRLREDKGKTHFTIMDFRNNSRKFADPEFDSDPVSVIDVKGNKKLPKPQSHKQDKTNKTPRKKQRINGVEFKVILQQNQCYDSEGNLITENLIDYTKKKLKEEYTDLNDFINKWTSGMKHEAIVNELYEHDIFLDELREVVGNDEIDDFDLICHIAFDREPLTRQERVNKVKKRDYLNQYEGVARKVLEGLLEKYASSGIENLEDTDILYNNPFKQYGNPKSIANIYFGSKENLLDAIDGLQKELYA